MRSKERELSPRPSLMTFLERLARLLTALPAAVKELLRWLCQTFGDLYRRIRGGDEARRSPRRVVKVPVVG